MTTVVVLAMHGAPANDFPSGELAEWFALHGQMEHASGPERERLEQRHAQLEARMRAWPRTAANDPFHASSLDLASYLSEALGLPVEVGFNEFCAPSLHEVLEQVVAAGAEQVVVVTPMLTRGGEHAERDIPAAIQAVQEQHPEVPIRYAWPFASEDVAGLLASRVAQVLDRMARSEQ
jgi:sirohydrochlorin cobaltochelatase